MFLHIFYIFNLILLVVQKKCSVLGELQFMLQGNFYTAMFCVTCLVTLL